MTKQRRRRSGGWIEPERVTLTLAEMADVGATPSAGSANSPSGPWFVYRTRMSTRGLIATVSGSGTTYRLTDGLGSTANLCDETGSVLVSYTYDAFGAVRTQSAASDDYFLFAGEQRDEESGLDYLRARYYDPATGRFLSLDPLGEGYPYARGNPVNFVDPTGLWTQCIAWNSYENDPATGQPLCEYAVERDSVGAGELVLDPVTGRWVAAGDVPVANWEEGDSSFTEAGSVTKEEGELVTVCVNEVGTCETFDIPTLRDQLNRQTIDCGAYGTCSIPSWQCQLGVAGVVAGVGAIATGPIGLTATVILGTTATVISVGLTVDSC